LIPQFGGQECISKLTNCKDPYLTSNNNEYSVDITTGKYYCTNCEDGYFFDAKVWKCVPCTILIDDCT